LKGQFSSDFHGTFGVHLGTITANCTRSLNVVVITHNFVGDRSAPAGAAAEAAKIALKGQISSDFHDAFGVQLGTITAHCTRSRNVVLVTHNFLGDSAGLCMSNTSYLEELPEIHFTGKSRLEDTCLPLSTSSTHVCV
jgi:hypothetical protein